MTRGLWNHGKLMSVVFAIILAAVVLGEPLNWRHYLGGALIVAGAVILVWA